MDLTGRFYSYAEHIIRCLAEREDEEPLKMPIQTKYLKKARK
jgi:hypothetical protein